MKTALRALALCAGITATFACQTTGHNKHEDAEARPAAETPKAESSEAAPAATSDKPVTAALSSGDLSGLQDRLNRSVNPILGKMDLQDPAKAKRAEAILKDYYVHMWAWHETADEKLNPLWEEWAAARNETPRSVPKVEGIVGQLRAVYADFKPIKDDLVAKMRSDVSPEALLVAKDYMTRANGVERTYGVYLEVVPELNETQKKFLHDEMVAAREEAMQAHAENEKKSWFKVHKDVCEAYCTAAGYDWKTHLKAWSDKGKAEQAAKDAAKPEPK